jgi:hypothetical protein
MLDIVNKMFLLNSKLGDGYELYLQIFDDGSSELLYMETDLTYEAFTSVSELVKFLDNHEPGKDED